MKKPSRPQGRIAWKIFFSYLAIIIVAMFAVALMISRAIREFHLASLRRELTAQTRLLEPLIAPRFANREWSELDRLTRELAPEVGSRITIIRARDGVVVGESDRQRMGMEPHLQRPEVLMAIHGDGIGHAQRYSTSVREDMLYLALRFEADERNAGFIRLARPLTAVRETLGLIYWEIAAIGVLAALATATVGLLVIRRITGPLQDIRKGAERIASGDLQTRMHACGDRELNRVCEAMNHMADQLSAMLQRERREKTEVAAILGSMIEGVIAIDDRDRIISLNRAAAEILHLEPETVEHARFQAVVQIPGLQEVVARAVNADQPQEKEITVYNRENRHLQAHATKLQGPGEGERFGVLLVLHDITRIRKLENTRRQFVANVSHELRTPITAIQGALETVLDSTLDNRRDTKRFVELALRHTMRFDRLIHDLLLLSRIEQAEGATAKTAAANLVETIREATRLCLEQKPEISSRIEIECPPEITVEINATLLEQAIANLLNNAINYSPPESKVKIVGSRNQSGMAEIKVIDRGEGIAAEHLDRIFERFYRVDQARSRETGGTGLGLAIVKHIAQLHRGTVTVESQPGRGSVFTISIPTAQ